MATILSSEEAAKIAKEQAKRSDAELAERRQSRIRIHSEELDREDVIQETGFTDTIRMITHGLSREKYNRVSEFIQYPLTTVTLTNEIKKKIGRVFEGRDSNLDLRSSMQNVNEYLGEISDVRDFVKDLSDDALYGEFNTIIIVDKPEDENEPFCYALPVINVLDYHLTDGQFDFISFECGFIDGEQIVAVYDAGFYRKFAINGGNVRLLVENEHNIGYCPALFFNDKIYNKDQFQRKGLLNGQYGELSNFFLFETYKVYAEHYVPFPIVEHPEEACANPDCDNGIVLNDGHATTCNVCRNESLDLVAPGSAVAVVNDKEGETTAGLLRFIQIETKGLEYIRETQQLRRAKTIKSVTGSISLPDNQALNKDQIAASFEESNRIINDVKQNLERVTAWIIQTKTYAKFGEVSIQMIVNFGTMFFIKGANDLLNELEQAKKQNLPQNELASIYNTYLETKHKTNPIEKKRQLILASLEPMPFYNIEEINKFPPGLIEAVDLQMKLRFNELVARFELENGSVVDFGMELQQFEKINRIRETIKSYINTNNNG